MTVILGTVLQPNPGKTQTFFDLIAKGTRVAERLGANVHRMQGHIGVPPSTIAVVLQFDNFEKLGEYTITRDEDPEWQDVVKFAAASEAGEVVRLFDAVELQGLESSRPLTTGAIHTTLIQPIVGKFPTLLEHLGKLKEAHEAEGAVVHVWRYTTGDEAGKLNYTVGFDNVIELGRFADKLERNAAYQDLIASLSADPASELVVQRSYKALTL